MTVEPFRVTNEDIERERERHDRAAGLVREGRIDEARKIAWWPRNEDPPKVHWSRVPVLPCRCGKAAAEGSLSLCCYCGGSTETTPSLIPRQRPVEGP